MRQFPLLAFILLAIALRWGSFLPSVLDHDESTYIVIGNALLHGQTYFVDVIDTKPIGIFWIYAAMLWLGGGKIWAVRLFTAAVVGLTGWLLYKASLQASASYRAAWASGICYVLMSSVFKFFGLSPNTELFFVPLAVLAVWLVWPSGAAWWRYGLAGLALGLGFIIKYFIAADALALGLLLLWRAWPQRQALARAILLECVPLTVGFMLPLLALYAGYAQQGMTDIFWFYTFEVSSRYPVDAPFIKMALFILDFAGRYIIFFAMAWLAWREPLPQDRRWQIFALGWLVLCFVMTLLPGKTFGHYQIQMMPALSVLAGAWLHEQRVRLAGLRNFLTRIPAWLPLLLLLAVSAIIGGYYLRRTDSPKLVAQELQKELRPGEHFYTGDYHHIIYHLLHQPSPTPYVHSSLLYQPHHIYALGIDLDKEIERIFKSHPPALVLLRDAHTDTALSRYIKGHYNPVRQLADGVTLYRIQ